MTDTLSLHEALVQLERELIAFGTARRQLEDSQARAEESLRAWGERDSQHTQAQELLTVVLEDQQRLVTSQVNELATLRSSLATLAQAVDEAGFPARLETIQTVVATSQAAIQSLQSRLDQLESHLDGQLKLLASDVSRSLLEQQTSLRAALFEVSAGLVKHTADIQARVDAQAERNLSEMGRLVSSINTQLAATQERAERQRQQTLRLQAITIALVVMGLLSGMYLIWTQLKA
ncbi:hypothetical protein FJ251_11770 [bacterium]|nr:hypothetical protein [bacterium]